MDSVGKYGAWPKMGSVEGDNFVVIFLEVIYWINSSRTYGEIAYYLLSFKNIGVFQIDFTH